MYSGVYLEVFKSIEYEDFANDSYTLESAYTKEVTGRTKVDPDETIPILWNKTVQQ